MRRSWFRFLQLCSLLAAFTVLAACESGPRVITNSAPDFDIAGARTFAYMQPLGTDRGNVRSLLSNHLIESTTRELEAAGLKRVDSNPDLLVNFFVSTRETISTRPSTTASMHHSRGRYSTWRGYSFGVSTTEVVQRTEGTIAVDIVDPARNMLVWEGAASQRVTDSTRQNLQPVVDRAITDIFAQFP